MQAARQAARLQRELERLRSDPPPGACVWPADDKLLTRLEAQIQGPEHTVYAGGIFRLEVQIPERYPFEPPSMRFKTPIYHPNIDNGGRICLDLLNMPPKGSWKPSLNLSTLLTSIRLLLSEPNPDDGLMAEITAEYKHDRASFNKTALDWTAKHASMTEPAKHGSTTTNERNSWTSLPHARQDERQPGADTEQQRVPGYSGALDKDTEVVSDSGSEEENEPSSSWKGSSRLPLSQRSLALKRRKY